jgi:chaperonin cofactor prefoldin
MKANQAKTGAKSDYQQQLEKLRIKRQAASNKIKEIQQASEEAWQELKIGTEVAFETMKNAVDNAVSMFK